MAESKRANFAQGLNVQELVVYKVAQSMKNDRHLEKIISENITTTQNLFEAAHTVKDKAAMTNRTEQSVPNQGCSQKTTKTFGGKNFNKNSRVVSVTVER